MPALTAEAHNSDDVFAHLPVTVDTIATFLHNIVEFSASAARKRDTCVLAAVFAKLFSFFPPIFQHGSTASKVNCLILLFSNILSSPYEQF